MRRLSFGLALCATSALAMETQVLPKGTWMLDVGYMHSSIDKQWDGERRVCPTCGEETTAASLTFISARDTSCRSSGG
jgi:hypothetical protein